MKLADLLVSYKQVESPKVETPKIEDSSTKYQRMLEYLNNKTQKKQETEDADASDNSTEGFVGWDYSSLSSNPTSSNTPSTSQGTTSSTSTAPYSGKSKWVSDITAAYKRQGLSDNAIKNLIAKNALESGWGKSVQGNYNYGNITTGSNWTGKYVNGNDHNAAGARISQKFRSYDSMDDYVKDEIQFLTRLYDFNQDDDFDTFINKLQGGNKGGRKYAEDRQYSDKVRGVYNSI